MNNMFHSFSIKLTGQNLDDKLIFDYDDYRTKLDANELPHDVTLAKAVAFIRLYKLKQALSTIQVPVYFDIKFGTAGSAAVVPTAPELVIGFGSLENLTGTGIIDDVTLEAAKTKAIADLKFLVESTLNQNFVQFGWTTFVTTRDQHPGVSSEITVTELKEEYVTVPAVSVTATVTYIEQKA